MCYVAVQPRVARAVNLAHPTCARQVDALVRPDSRTGAEGHRTTRLWADLELRNLTRERCDAADRPNKSRFPRAPWQGGWASFR